MPLPLPPPLAHTLTRALARVPASLRALQFYEETGPLLSQMLQLLHSFVTRNHQSLASIGVAALIRMINLASPKMQELAWQEVTQFLLQVGVWVWVGGCAAQAVLQVHRCVGFQRRWTWQYSRVVDMTDDRVIDMT